MKILAFDTSSTACSIALLADEKITFTHDNVPMQQARLILPNIDALLSASHLKVTDLDAIAFGVGPGSFTGVRIATSVAQGLAFATHIPLIPISSLAAVAQSAYQDLGWTRLLVAMDARIGEVYWAAYVVAGQGVVELLGSEAISSPEAVWLPNDPGWYGVGTGWGEYREKLPFEMIALDATRLPMATAILSLARVKWLHSEWISARDALPVYLRDKVAVKKDTS